MSITTDLKGYADAAVETGRSVINDGFGQSRAVVNERLTKIRTTLDEGIDGAGARAGSLAETATGVGTQAADRVRYETVAAVGAVDAVVTGLVTRLQELPNDVVGTITRAQNTATDAADKLQGRFQTVLGSTQETVGDVRTGAIIGKTRGSAEAYRKQVEETLAARRADLHARGEAVVTELRKDPRVVRVASFVGAATETVEDAAAKPSRRRSAEQAQATRAHNERSARAKKAASTRARKNAAPAKKATARKSTAKKATTKAGS